jgi:hypothetical protein
MARSTPRLLEVWHQSGKGARLCLPATRVLGIVMEAGNNIAFMSGGNEMEVDSRRLCYTQTTHQYALREDYRSLPEDLAAPLVDKYLGT